MACKVLQSHLLYSFKITTGLKSISSDYGYDGSVYFIFILMATREKIQIMPLRNWFFPSVGPTLMLWPKLGYQAHKEISIEVRKAFFMHQPSVQKEATWI